LRALTLHAKVIFITFEAGCPRQMEWLFVLIPLRHAGLY
jgi:hypothetical protein